MNKKVKRIIAREFLTLLILVVLESLTFVFVSQYNSYQKNKIKKIDKSLVEKEKLTDDINILVHEKIEKELTFKNKLELNGKEFTDEQADHFWKILTDIHKKDSIVYLWDNSWGTDFKIVIQSTGLKDGYELNQFIIKNSLSREDSILLTKLDTIQKETSYLTKQKTDVENKIINNNEKLEILERIGIVLFGILFILRYLIYGVKWSLKTLKEN